MPREMLIPKQVVGRVGRKQRPPHRPVMRVYSGGVELDNFLALSQMAHGVPCRADMHEGWYEVVSLQLRWRREMGIVLLENDLLLPFDPEDPHA